MFDPTAYENMRVVIEGYLYDKDLDGELSIIDRNDIVNLAKLSREYSIQFRLRDCTREQQACFILKAGLENLSSELLPDKIKSTKQGCFVKLQFNLIHTNEALVFDKIQAGLQDIWGEHRKIQQCVHFNPFSISEPVQNQITIEFNRIIVEDQMDDLIIMIDHIVETLVWLNTQIH